MNETLAACHEDMGQQRHFFLPGTKSHLLLLLCHYYDYYVIMASVFAQGGEESMKIEQGLKLAVNL